MEFRLIRQGVVYPSGNKKNRPGHKHDIRKQFHPQLRRLWQEAPQMNHEPTPGIMTWNAPKKTHTIEHLMDRFKSVDYNFVPLVTEQLSVFCELEILFLRKDQLRSVVRSTGDIDGKIKTILDALRYPKDKAEFGAYELPSDDEKPFYCLLQDDKLISKLSVETDLLLRPTSGEEHNPHDSLVIITIRIRPMTVTWDNIRFG
jgi:hypothetical protein